MIGEKLADMIKAKWNRQQVGQQYAYWLNDVDISCLALIELSNLFFYLFRMRQKLVILSFVCRSSLVWSLIGI